MRSPKTSKKAPKMSEKRGSPLAPANVDSSSMPTAASKTRPQGQNLLPELRASKKGEFIDAYVRLGNVSRAAKAAGIDPSLVYYYLDKDIEFKQQYLRARQVIGDRYIAEVAKRAVKGKSDILLMFLVKAYKHEFRDKVADIQVNAELNLAIGLLEELRQAGASPPRSDSPS